MSDKKGINRRQFITTTSAAAGAAALLATVPSADAARTPEAFRSQAGSLIPYSRHDVLTEPGVQRTFTDGQLSEIAFPLGGIGTGTISLGGRGQLRDWEIFNRPGKGKTLPLSFAALWTRPEGESGTVHVVEGPLMPPFPGAGKLHLELAEALPRFKKAKFTGAYPCARVDFEHESLPLNVWLEAFNPFIPLNVDDSSLPVAVLRYHLTCRGKKPVDYALAFSLLNAVGYDGVADLTFFTLGGEGYAGFGKNLTRFRQEEVSPGLKVSGLEMTSEKYGRDSPRHGSMALLTTHPQVTFRTAWESSVSLNGFSELLMKWLNEFTKAGGFHDSTQSEPSQDNKSNYATLSPRGRLLPGESATITFLLAWYFPIRENYWDSEPEVKGQILRNYYGKRFKDAWDVGFHTAARLKELEDKTRSFHSAFFSSTVPPYVLDAVSSQASIIRTNTCMLLEGKQFFAFEGCGEDVGCCPMNDTHVWNYAHALAFLYPELARSMRRTDFLYNMRPDGNMSFLTLVPVEGHAQSKANAAADGQMSCIIELYREWQISGDDGFLRELWPEAKRALEFAWVQWDADRDGVMEGRQLNTYNVEFYGPNTRMSTLYLGALKAGELMATAVGDQGAAETYREIRNKGRRNLEELWNGDFYIQKVPPVDQIHLLERGTSNLTGVKQISGDEVDYQYGEGCLSDQLLGQWFAEVVGLGYALAPERVRRALLSIYRFNFKHSFYDYPSTQRIFALNDEKGLLNCTWPKGNRPAFPFLYSDEVWTGVEYQVAAHLIYEECLEEGLAIVKGIRDRHDGLRRNPWNEGECGHHYARALSSWSVLLALSGFRYSAPERCLFFDPRVSRKKFRSFFAAGSAWGIYSQEVTRTSHNARLEIRNGELSLRYLNVRNEIGTSSFSASATLGPSGNRLEDCKVKVNPHGLQIDFGQELVIPEGGTIAVVLLPVK